MTAYSLNPTSERTLTKLSAELPNSLLLFGPDGIGFQGALELIKGERELFIIEPEKDGQIDRDKGTIPIEAIRGLYDLARSRVSTERIIVIQDADRMAAPAQNAFLKLLEEPNDMIHFVLLAHTPNKLLPTIRSRVQSIELRPISSKESEKLLDTLGVTDPTTRSQLLFVAEGLPALLTRYATQPNLFDNRAQIVRDARTFLTESPYQKLAIAEQYKDKREETLILLTDAAKLLKRSPEPRSIQSIGAILKAYDRIVQNGNIRLQLASLVV